MNVNDAPRREPQMNPTEVARSMGQLAARGLLGSGERASGVDDDVFTRDLGPSLARFIAPPPSAARAPAKQVHATDLEARLASGGALGTLATMVSAAEARLRGMVSSPRRHVSFALADGWLTVHAGVMEGRDGARTLKIDHRANIDSPLHAELRDALNDLTALSTITAQIDHLRTQLPKLPAEAERGWRALHDLRVRVTADTNGGPRDPDVLLDAFLRDVPGSQSM